MRNPASRASICVEVTRGDVVEARHVLHAVVLRDERVELVAGNAQLVTYLRSSAKPIQALPVARARPELDDEQLAVMCASHRATPEQLTVVRRLLAAAPATEEDLECGGASPIEHNCSGKHAGFLALCRAEGWPTRGYSRLEHPCQQTVVRELASLAGLDPSSMPVGVDGCGVPTLAMTLERAALVFARLRGDEAGRRVCAATQAHPELLLGPVDLDARLVSRLDGWVAKGGAEGLFCAASADGLALANQVRGRVVPRSGNGARPRPRTGRSRHSAARRRRCPVESRRARRRAPHRRLTETTDHR